MKMSGYISPSDMYNVMLSSDSETGDFRSDSGSYNESNRNDGLSNGSHNLDPDISQDELEEKQRLINQVLELQNTLDDLSCRVDSVKEENLKLKSENQVLGQYIENLMAASSVFQSTSPKANKKK